jgi:hypothetical protein
MNSNRAAHVADPMGYSHLMKTNVVDIQVVVNRAVAEILYGGIQNVTVE